MRDTIQWLVQMPEQERTMMEAAENHTFVFDSPAPALHIDDAATNFVDCVLLDMFSVEATALLASIGCKPALLNFAHGYNCGGGFDHSAGSQEEDIFRKTSIFLSLWPHRRSDDGPGVLKRGMWIGDFDETLPRKEPFYEHTQCGGIYSPHVRVVRDLRSPANHLCDAAQASTLPLFATLTVAAQNVNWDRSFCPKLLRQKIRTALWMAASRRHDAVVLGAFGCGYFSNPPDVVAKTFHDLLRPGGEFATVFRFAVFAIPHDGGPRGNFSTFRNYFPLVNERQLLERCSKTTPEKEKKSQKKEERLRQRNGRRQRQRQTAWAALAARLVLRMRLPQSRVQPTCQHETALLTKDMDAQPSLRAEK